MRVTIIALGSRGDVQPYIPLGEGLQKAGHRVRIATFQKFAPLVLNAGIDFHPLQGDARELLNAAMNSGLLSGRSNPLRFIRAIKTSYASLAVTLAADLSAPELLDSELILNQLPAYLYGGDLAEFLGIPWAIVSVIPLTRSRYNPMIGFPRLPSFIPGYNSLTYRLGEQMAWGIFRSAVNQWRTEVLGLERRSFFGNFDSIFQGKVPVINGFSRQIVERPPDWGDQVHTTGWWHPSDPSWEPSARLQDFLDKGAKPVFIGFGSIPVGDPGTITALVVEAIRKIGARAIILSGWAGLGEELPEEFLAIDYAPYEWLFRRMSAIIHHGGSGTSGFAFRSGVPMLVVPFGFDQYYWGDRAVALGVGPEPLPFKELTAESLAGRIQDILTNNNMAIRAAELGQKISAENGVGRAVEIIESIGGS